MNNNVKRYLGIDWGEVRIGLALGDSETRIATPFITVKTLAEVLRVIAEEETDIIVLGRPDSISNSQFPVSKEFEKFQNTLESQSGIPVILVDERLSSKAADALSGGRKGDRGRDEVAAMIILQSYLDRHE